MTLRTTRSRTTAAIAGCALLAAAGGAGGSFAWFGDADASTGNAAEAASIELTGIDPAANRVLPAAPGAVIQPGGSDASGVQEVGNGGEVAGDLTVRVTQVDLSANDLSSVLRMTIEECAGGTGSTCTGAVTKYDGLLKNATTPIALGALAPGATRRVRVRVYWPLADANTALYNDTLGFRLAWRLRTSL